MYKTSNKAVHTAQNIYIYSVVIALGLLFYANAETVENPDGSIVQIGIGKSFYIPCGIAFVCSFFLQKERNCLDNVLNWLIVVALVSSLIHPPTSNDVLTWTLTRLIFAILCFRDIRIIDPWRFVKILAKASPFIIFPHYILSNPFAWGAYRYGGFYGDPNFLALALNFIVAICYMAIIHEKRFFLKMTYTISIIGAVPLILVGMSRGGILGMLFLFCVILVNLWKISRKYFLLLLIIMNFSISPFFSKMEDIVEIIEYRFSNESASDANGAKARWDGIYSAFQVFSNRPELIPFGIGLGNTYATIIKYKEDGYYCKYAIHNTFISLMYEAGIIALILYLYIFLYTFRILWKRRDYLLTGLLLSAILSLMTLPGVTFMPGWMLLFFVANKKLSSCTGRINTII